MSAPTYGSLFSGYGGLDLAVESVFAPDLDKLVRSVGDALTESGLIRDDALVVGVAATKIEVTGWTGATIAIEQVPA